MFKYIIIFFTALILEIGSTFYISNVADKNLLGMITFAFIGPFLSLPFVGYIVESKTWKDRIKISITQAIGYTIGCIISYCFF